MKLGQPDLFTKRVRRPPAASEFKVHCAIARLLDINLQPGWVWFHPANGELRSKVTGARVKAMGAKPGVPDFILVGPPAGRVHALELKRRGLRPSEVQYAFLLALEGTGAVTAWADTFDRAIEIFKGWGALRVKL